MLSLIFLTGVIWIFGKLFFAGLKAAWGISKFLVTIILLPVVLIIMAASGLFFIAFLILIAVGVIAHIGRN